MRQVIVRVLVIGVMFGMSGCTSIFSSASLKNINSYSDARKSIKNGMTMQQVQAKLGRPNGKTSYNAEITWVYSEAKQSEQTFKNVLYQGLTGGAVMDVKVVQVVFRNGRVKNHTIYRTYTVRSIERNQ
jgi:outer membrane protein assembly factor BamE (lipoprotein component of BamABCDE complex)